MKIFTALYFIISLNCFAGGGVDVGNGFANVQFELEMERGFPSEQHFIDEVEHRFNNYIYDTHPKVKEIKQFYNCKSNVKNDDVELQEYYPFETNSGLLKKEYKGKIRFSLSNCKNKVYESLIIIEDILK